MRCRRSVLAAGALLAGVLLLLGSGRPLPVAVRAAGAPRDVLALVRHGALYTQALDGSAARLLWQPATGTVSAPRWSPDGTRIAVVGPDGNLWVVAATTGSAQPLTQQAVAASGCGTDVCQDPGTQVDTPRWAPDGQQLSYRLVAHAATATLWVIAAAGGPPRQVAAAPDLCLFNEGWTADGAPLVSRCATPETGSNATYRVDTAGQAQLFVGGAQLSVGRDGRIAYTQMVLQDDVMIVTLHVCASLGAADQVIAADGQEAVWSAGGLLAYQVNGPAGWRIHVHDLATRADAVVATGRVVGWSAAGDWLHYLADDATGTAVWRVHPDGSAAETVAVGEMADIAALP